MWLPSWKTVLSMLGACSELAWGLNRVTLPALKHAIGSETGAPAAREVEEEAAAGRCLNFLHIPKTGGTSIEHVWHGTMAWGRSAFHMMDCVSPHEGIHEILQSQKRCNLPDGERCLVWHTPPAMDSKLSKYYEECDTFCVVRHPVERLLSEYLWAGGRVNGACNIADFRRFVETSFESLRTSPYKGGCHFVPQVDYVFGPNAHPETAGQYCQHVLKQENLTSEFNELMRHYDLPLQLREHEKARSECALEIPDDLWDAITAHYAADMAAFGYSFW
eukprot:TRINITY_DN5344_c0_g1_i2.p1 TRINITY_DN5344_c0_g1~~TRINITY_DN5344_c0_g1_i2.p1  ORF type:complete len:276 (-),score=36.06 TRINITY_DN5344_c0_g1_i2:276-1103(-)